MKKSMLNYACRLILLQACLLLFSFCVKGPDSDTFFNFPVTEIRDREIESGLEVPYIGSPGGKLADCVIKDDYLFSFSNQNEYIYSVSSIDSSELVCQLFKKGRAWNEPMMTLPIWDLYEDDGDTKGLLFSYFDSKLFICNVTASLSSGADRYDRVVKLDGGREGMIKILTFYQTSDSTMIAYNTKVEGSKDYMVEPPVFEIYNTLTGELLDSYGLFNMIYIESDDKEYTSKNYLYHYSDIKPDRTKLAFCMANIPQINILDIAAGEAVGFRIKDYKGFTAKRPVKHFASLQCDDEFIYALYSDKESAVRDSDLLYVFDWGGNIRYKYRLDNSFTDLHLDGNMLYFSYGISDKLYGIPVASLIQ